MDRPLRIHFAMAFGIFAICCDCRAQDVRISSMTNSIHNYEVLVQQSVSSRDGETWFTLARLYQDVARYKDAEQAYSKALVLLKVQDPVALASAMDCMGTMYVAMGKYDKGEKRERKALTMREAQHDSLGVGLSWMHLGMLELGKHHASDAAMYAQWAVDRIVTKSGTEQNGATPEQKMTALIDLALALCAQGRGSLALISLTQAHEIAEANYPMKSFPVAYIDFLLGYAHWKSGELELAAEQMKNGTSSMYAQLGWGHPTFIAAMEQYAGFLKETRRRTEAAEVKQQIARVREAQ